MWLLVFIFLVVTLLLGWLLFGYFILIWFVGLFRRRPPCEFPASWPLLSLIVPCHNEEEHILAKLDDVRRLDYPADRLEVVFADGASTDKTVALLREGIKPGEPYRVVVCPEKGKINQLNHVLPLLKGDIIVNSDTDSRLSADALKWLAAEFAADEDVWVVGAYCRPAHDTLEIERYYWDAQNKGRLMETDARTSSIVIAQCYAFRRGLLQAFPEDVIADDIYVALLASSKRHRTVYSRKAVAVETRTPQTHAAFLPHKFRKSNAFLRESLRFVYKLPDMGSFCKMMLVTRVAQQLLLPWTGLLWFLIAGVLMTLFRFDIVAFGVIVLLILFAMASRIFAWVRLPEGSKKFSAVTVIKGYVLTNAIILATGVSYPFFRQGSSYRRIG